MRAIGSFAVLLVCTFAACAGEPATTEETKAQVEALVKKLASEKYEERRTASAALLDLGPSVYDAVKRAREQTKDTEVRTQLDIVLLHWPTPHKTLDLSGIPGKKKSQLYERLYKQFAAECKRIRELDKHLGLKRSLLWYSSSLGDIYRDIQMLRLEGTWNGNLHNAVQMEEIEMPGGQKVNLTSELMDDIGTICAANSAAREERMEIAERLQKRWEAVTDALDRVPGNADDANHLKLTAARDEMNRYLFFLRGGKTELKDRLRFETITLRIKDGVLSDTLFSIELQGQLVFTMSTEEVKESIFQAPCKIEVNGASPAEVLEQILEPHGLTYKLVPEEKPTTIQICKK